ncbi:hypothetical protein SAZ11_54400 [Streptomyces sp. FXJ1.4098]|nr:hypothetical protein [Streptomyces sp. FXJ1.4098]
MVNVLGDSAALADARGRHQWRRELSEAFGGLELEPYPTAHQEFFEAVRACGERPGGLETLVEITGFVAPALPHRLLPLVDEWDAADLYRGRDWSALRQALDIGIPELNAIVAEVCGDRFRLPPHCTTAWHAFLHLACRNTPPGVCRPAWCCWSTLPCTPIWRPRSASYTPGMSTSPMSGISPTARKG